MKAFLKATLLTCQPAIELLLFLFFTGCNTPHDYTSGKNVSGNVLSLKEWYFLPDIENIGEKEKWYAPFFDASQWKKVSVPSAWDTYDPALWGYEGAAWYIIHIPGGSLPTKPFLTLDFGRVNYLTRGWFNGVFLGEHLGGYLPFSWDITNLVHRDDDNILVLEVDNRTCPEWLPGSRQIEWVQYGGILQPARICGHDSLYLIGVDIDASPRGEGAEIVCKVRINNRSKKKSSITLRLRIGEDKTPTRKIEVSCPAGEITSQTCTLTLPIADLWTLSSPKLFHLETTLLSGEVILDHHTSRFGVRNVHIRGRHILLNNRPLYIRGVNRYDISGRQGPVYDRKMILEDLKRIKETGVNTLRVHYPQSPLLLDLLDSLGLLLIEELPLNWWGQTWWDSSGIVQDTSILPQARATLRKMIERDRNHPCILAWSVANECKTETEPGNYVISSLIREAHRLDTTRPVTFTVNNETRLHQAYRLADIVSYNLYPPVDSALHLALLDSEICHAAEQYLASQLEAWPDKPLLVSEFGTAGIYSIHGNAPLTEEYQAAYIQAVWKAILHTPDCSGGILWCWKDYYHRKYFTQTYAPFGPYGVFNVDGKTKKSYSTLKEMFNKH